MRQMKKVRIIERLCARECPLTQCLEIVPDLSQRLDLPI